VTGSPRRTGSAASPGRTGRTGRRPGNPDTRQAILDAARSEFAARGFAGTTVRAIAATAGVDPALLHHYFGTKQQLFLATIEIPVDPSMVVDAVADGPREGLGLRLASTVLGVWESPAGPALIAALRSALVDPAVARMVREFLFSQVIGRVLRQVDCPPEQVSIRGALLVSQLAGVLVGRHILALEPLASAPLEALVPNVAATLQRYLTGPLPPPASALPAPVAALVPAPIPGAPRGAAG